MASSLGRYGKHELRNRLARAVVRVAAGLVLTVWVMLRPAGEMGFVEEDDDGWEVLSLLSGLGVFALIGFVPWGLIHGALLAGVPRRWGVWRSLLAVVVPSFVVGEIAGALGFGG